MTQIQERMFLVLINFRQRIVPEVVSMNPKYTTTVLVFGMLLTGSINTLSKKMGYNTCRYSFLTRSVVYFTEDFATVSV